MINIICNKLETITSYSINLILMFSVRSYTSNEEFPDRACTRTSYFDGNVEEKYSTKCYNR